MRLSSGVGLILLINVVAQVSGGRLAHAQPSPPPQEPPTAAPPTAAPPTAAPPTAAPPTAGAEQASPEPAERQPTESERVESNEVLATGPVGLAALLTPDNCELHQIELFYERWYVACGQQGLWVFTPDSSAQPQAAPEQPKAAPELYLLAGKRFRLSRRHFSGATVVRLSKQPGQLVAYVQLPLALASGDRPPEAAVLALSAPEDRLLLDGQTRGRVIEQDDLRFKVDLGYRDGVYKGSRLLFVGPRETVGRVVEVHDEFVWARLGMGEPFPEPGSQAQPTPRSPTRKLAFTPNSNYHAAVRLGARVGNMNQVGSLMGTGEFDAFLRWGPWRAGVQAGPVGGGGGIFVYQVSGRLGLHHTIGGVNLEFGSMRINSNNEVPPGAGVAFGPSLRVGPEDGLHVQSRVLVAVSYKKTVVGEVRVQVQVPVYQGVWILARGSGGDAGVTTMDVGPRFLVDGAGGPESWFLHIFAGGLWLQDTGTPDQFSVFRERSGPALGCEWEVRL